jgi:hypothetical protein
MNIEERLALEARNRALRDEFAGRAMQAILTGSGWTLTGPIEVAEKAYEYAEAMIKVRKAK